jgi:phosphatidate cytidylyltransferase
MALSSSQHDDPVPFWWSTELSKRIMSGIVLAIVTVLATYEGGWPFSMFWLAAGIAILREWLRMSRCNPFMPLLIGLGLSLVALFLSRLMDHDLWIGAFILGFGLAYSCMMGANKRDKLWASFGFLASAIIVKVPPLVRDDVDFGIMGLIWMFAVVWTTDIAAFFTGRTLGGPKLWPSVSPKKTWSGFAGGLIGGAGAGILVAWTSIRYGAEPEGLWAAAILSIIASLASQCGDLAESAMKRHFGVKDAGTLIPGHGGVMDRLDGFFAVAAFLGMLLLFERFL